MVDVTSLETPFGTLWLAANERGLCRLALPTVQEHERFQEWLGKRFPSAIRNSQSVASPKPPSPVLQSAIRLPPPLAQGGPQAGGNPQSTIEGRESEVLTLAKNELSEYLAGARRRFTVPLALDGSAFFQQVWDALIDIPYGRTMTYAALATGLQRPRAFRAVGSACAKNPVPLIIPCHRAVGSNGSLTGFAGGLGMKEALLKMEGAIGG